MVCRESGSDVRFCYRYPMDCYSLSVAGCFGITDKELQEGDEQSRCIRLLRLLVALRFKVLKDGRNFD